MNTAKLGKILNIVTDKQIPSCIENKNIDIDYSLIISEKGSERINHYIVKCERKQQGIMYCDILIRFAFWC